jgi:hypothetical protein
MIKTLKHFIIILLAAIAILVSRNLFIDYQLKHNYIETNALITNRDLIVDNEQMDFKFGGLSTNISIKLKYEFYVGNKKYKGTIFLDSGDINNLGFGSDNVVYKKVGDSITIKYSRLFPSINSHIY